MVEMPGVQIDRTQDTRRTDRQNLTCTGQVSSGRSWRSREDGPRVVFSTFFAMAGCVLNNGKMVGRWMDSWRGRWRVFACSVTHRRSPSTLSGAAWSPHGMRLNAALTLRAGSAAARDAGGDGVRCRDSVRHGNG
jgi:hypothetical protein